MSKTFTIALPPETDGFLENAQKAAEGLDVTLEGDETAGVFSGRGVEGTYRVQGGEVSVTITKKPVVAPWPMIEAIVRDFFV